MLDNYHLQVRQLPPSKQRFPSVLRKPETTRDSMRHFTTLIFEFWTLEQAHSLMSCFDYTCKYSSGSYRLLGEFQRVDILRNQVKLTNIVKS